MAVATLLKQERIKRIHHAFVVLMMISKRRFAQRLQSFGLTPPQFITLAALSAHQKPCTMSDLTDVTFHDAPTMTGIIDRLVKMKLVQRTRSETDRRVVLVQTTPAGSELARQIEEQSLLDDFDGCTALTDEDLEAMEQLLKYMLRLLVGRYKSLTDADLDAEIEKLQLFMTDPIYYMKLEDDKVL
jgi:DNA-binding MarR family transcriptional regulator